jgi:MFS transporter, ACS family, tartrate transporter
MHTQLSPDQQRRTIHKAAWRLLPLMVLAYLVNYIDRSNISFAALTMNKDLGFSASVFGTGAGIFFIGYALFEVPSNMVLQRTSARLWIARIMITWGIVSALMAAVSGPWSFWTLRFLLGVAEAGFFPGIIYYLTRWFPSVWRARAIAIFYLAVPISNGVASIASAWILHMDGLAGLRGWQWVFILEALPAIALAFVVLARMTERPSEATWLEPAEREWLEEALRAENQAAERHGIRGYLRAMTDMRIVLLAAIYTTGVTASYGLVFFMPQIVKGLGLSTLATGFVSAIPYTFGTIALIAFGISSDRRNERRWHLIVSTALVAIGLLATGVVSHSYWAVVTLCIAAVGIYASRPSFWPIPSSYLSGPEAAVGLALINSVGNLGGYVGPQIVGWMKDSTGTFEAPLYFLGACGVLSTIVCLAAVRTTGGSRVAAAAARAGVPLAGTESVGTVAPEGPRRL